MKFKKIATVLGSALMVGSTMGFAAAAAYPAPFVQNGVANVAIVYGTNGAELSDNTAAMDISADLGSKLAGQAVGGVVTVTGGETFKLEKSSNYFNVNDTLNSIYSTLDSEDMDFLTDGTYKQSDVDEDYEQTISLGTNTLGLFADSDFMNDKPSVGFKWTNAETILNYTIEFDNGVNFTEMLETDMPLLGNEYYVLAASADEITLLDSANSLVVSDGDEVTVNGKTVSIEYISSTQVKFNVDGEVTDSMTEGDSEQLEDGSYIVLTDNLYAEKESGVSKAEFSIGSGKIILGDGDEVIVGEDSDDEIDGLIAHIENNSEGLLSITLQWTSDDETFLAEGNPIMMPGLGVLGLSFEGLVTPSDSEMITINNGESISIDMGNYDFPLAEYVTTNSSVVSGEEDYPLVLATSIGTNTTWTSPARTADLTDGLALVEKDRFVVTSIGTDLSDVETLYYEVKNIENDSGTIEVVLEDLIGNNDITFDALEDSDRGIVTVTLEAVNGSTVGAAAYISFADSDASTTIYYDRLVSQKGLIVDLPVNASTYTLAPITADIDATLTLIEADDNEDLGLGKQFTVNISLSDNEKLHVSSVDTTNLTKEEVSGDKYTGLVNSALASVITTDESGDEYDFSVEYFGKEVTADVTVVAGGETSESDTTELGTIVVKDSEADKMTGKNLIVVGGNCVNSVAAELLELSAGASCQADFTAKTGVANGGFLIQSFAREGKVAMLVAGYSAADTTKAKTYLVANGVADTAAGKKITGTGVTAADVVIA